LTGIRLAGFLAWLDAIISMYLFNPMGEC